MHVKDPDHVTVLRVLDHREGREKPISLLDPGKPIEGGEFLVDPWKNDIPLATIIFEWADPYGVT